MTSSLDIEQPEALTHYLRDTARIRADECPSIRLLEGGVSNRTVLVERDTGEAWVFKQALEKLRVASDWFASTERVHREAQGLRWLGQLAPQGSTVDFLFEDHQHHIIAMKAVPQPHQNWKTMLLNGEIKLEHVAQFGKLLGTLECRALEHRDELERAFADRSYFEALRLEPYYAYTAKAVPAAASFLAALIAQTRANRQSLVHGDYSPKNVLVFENRLILLDHEVIHFGDPAFDLGFSMTHLLSKAHHLTTFRPSFLEAAHHYWKAYTSAAETILSPELEVRAVQNTLGCLLARAAGRSPLEYLDQSERNQQIRIVLKLIANQPNTILALIETFASELSEETR
jgi:5-methylthioribose kinase